MAVAAKQRKSSEQNLTCPHCTGPVSAKVRTCPHCNGPLFHDGSEIEHPVCPRCRIELKKVKTEKDIMRYDAIVDNHHHLYCTDTDKIEDYHDEAITRLLEDYFKNHPIKRFAIQDIKLQITGQFKK